MLRIVTGIDRQPGSGKLYTCIQTEILKNWNPCCIFLRRPCLPPIPPIIEQCWKNSKICGSPDQLKRNKWNLSFTHSAHAKTMTRQRYMRPASKSANTHYVLPLHMLKHREQTIQSTISDYINHLHHEGIEPRRHDRSVGQVRDACGGVSAVRGPSDFPLHRTPRQHSLRLWNPPSIWLSQVTF